MASIFQTSTTPVPRPGRETPFRRVLCAVNGTRVSSEAVRQALSLVHPSGRISFVAVSDERGTGHWEQASLSARHAEEALDEARRVADEAMVEVVTHLLHGDPQTVTLALAEHHDLLVLGAHGHSRAAGMFVGSLASKAVHVANVPVMLARVGGDTPFPGLVVAATAGEADEETARVAAAIAASHDKPLVLGHAEHRDDAATRHALAEQVTAARDLTGTEPTVVSERGDPVDTVCDVAREAGARLVVTGSSGRRGVAALGSVSERIAHRALCSVLVLRHP